MHAHTRKHARTCARTHTRTHAREHAHTNARLCIHKMYKKHSLRYGTACNKSNKSNSGGDAIDNRKQH